MAASLKSARPYSVIGWVKMASPPPEFKFRIGGTFERDLDKFSLYLQALQGELAPAAERAMKKATLAAMTEITDRIRAGKYKKLSPLTATLKNLEGYSDLPLIRTGALIRSISREVLSPYKGVVGVNKNARMRKRGGSTDIGSIAVGLHEGMRIRVTDKMRRAFMRKLGAAAKKAGGASFLRRRGSSKGIIRIPPRPFIKAVFEDAAFIAKVEGIFWDEIYKAVGLGGSGR